MLKLDINLCKGCGYCIDECPKNVLEFEEEASAKGYFLCKIARPEDCIECKRCELICPEMAIYIIKDSKPYNKKSKQNLSVNSKITQEISQQTE